jgi:predicted ribosome quality control (RQC) complex YloA/Tae2 family protein
LRVLCVAVCNPVQAMDYTVIKAVCTELSTKWTPAKIERIVQADRFTLLIAIRTVEDSGWLRLCWNPDCAHVSVGDPPGGVPSIAEAFSFGEQLRYLLKGLAIIEVCELELKISGWLF